MRLHLAPRLAGRRGQSRLASLCPRRAEPRGLARADFSVEASLELPGLYGPLLRRCLGALTNAQTPLCARGASREALALTAHSGEPLLARSKLPFATAREVGGVAFPLPRRGGAAQRLSHLFLQLPYAGLCLFAATSLSLREGLELCCGVPQAGEAIATVGELVVNVLMPRIEVCVLAPQPRQLPALFGEQLVPHPGLLHRLHRPPHLLRALLAKAVATGVELGTAGRCLGGRQLATERPPLVFPLTFFCSV
mmetsp:Transcript_8647/g.22365  ORF Transcript_8647/g.22365 Transcript_8647/m.22365 type:complete len:252 (-) Transcript_8647:251-1006(-)